MMNCYSIKRLQHRAQRVAVALLVSAGILSSAPSASAASLQAAQGLFRRGDYLGAARASYDVMNSSSGDTRVNAEFWLAQALKGAGLPYAASFFYGRVVSKGSRSTLFRPALESLSDINARIPLGRANIAGLFRSKLDPLSVPPSAQGFYFYYRGLETFENNPTRKTNLIRAKSDFDRVPGSSPYYSLAQFYLGIIYSTLKNPESSASAFKRAQSRAGSQGIRELSTMNLARANYELKSYRNAFEQYSKIPRDSDLWLQSLLEGAWAFFVIQKHNNTLGNIHTLHSPFFKDRFYPESYILQAITYLRLCRYESAKDSLKSFGKNYKNKFVDLNKLLKTYNRQYAGFYDVIAKYKNTKRVQDFSEAAEIADSVSRSDAFKEGQQVVRALDRERSTLRSRSGRLGEGMVTVLRKALEDLRLATAERTGQQGFDLAVQLFRYLQDLSNQVRLINIELLSGQTDALRSEYQGESFGSDSSEWGEGMKELDLKRQLEFWPFEQEYWEDELGAYVYNIDSKCGGSKKKGR